MARDKPQGGEGGADPTPFAPVAPSSPPHATRKPESLRVFVSYSRDDLDFADQLVIGLEFAGFTPTIDRLGISGGEDWKRRLGNLIRESDTVVFVLSPSSALSEICAWEVDEAVRLGRRIIPILCRPLDGTSPPQLLCNLNYIYFYQEPKLPGSGFAAGLTQLTTALNTDIEWHREHTRILIRATEWDVGGRQASRLLSGTDIRAAKDWAAGRPRTAPELIELQRAFILASEQESEARNNAERRRLAEIAAAQDTRARALADTEAALREVAEAQRRRATLRNVLLAVMTVAAGMSGWSWYTIREGNKQLAKQVRVAEVSASRASAAQKRAQKAEFDAIVNECTASGELLRSTPGSLAVQNYMSCAVRFAFALIRNEQPAEVKTFLDRVRETSTRLQPNAKDDTVSLYGMFMAQAEAVGDCAAQKPKSPSRSHALGQLLLAANALVAFRPPYSEEQRWREEIFRGFLYLSKFSYEEGKNETAHSYASTLVDRLSAMDVEEVAARRDLARALDHLSWTALLTKRFDDALTASERAIQIVNESRIGDLSSIRLNYAHALLLNGKVKLARTEYEKFLPSDFTDDIGQLIGLGICNPYFSELIGAAGRCNAVAVDPQGGVQ